MSTAIRDVSDTLIELLRSLVNIVTPESIALVSPAEANQAGGVLLGLSLYSIVPAADYRNEMEVYGDLDHGEAPSQPLDLYYLLTSFPAAGDNATEKTLNTQHVLAYAMRVFFDNGILTGSLLRGDLPRDQELRLTLQPITLEDLTRIFGVFPENALQTSVSYVVSPVKLLSTRAVPAGPRVSIRQTDIDQAVPVT
jgi:hypothetical protein